MAKPMADDDVVVSRRVRCSCYSRDYYKTWNVETKPSTRVWRCTNCNKETPRVWRARRIDNR